MFRSLTDSWTAAAAVAAVAVAPVLGVFASPPASADCVSSNGTVLCSQGDTRGSNTGQGPGSVSHPCDFDWYCDYDGFDYGIVLDPDFDGGISRPNRPNNDLPGRGGGGRGGRR